MTDFERLAHGYYFAKNYVISKGYAYEIDWQDSVSFDELTEQKFLKEFAWVVIASGLSDHVVRRIFPLIKKCLFDFASTQEIFNNRDKCYKACLAVFNHPGKVGAIFSIVNYINLYSFPYLKALINQKGPSFLMNFPYMGKATSLHLAKNIGIDVAKPDRHLLRISSTLGFDDVDQLCTEISQLLGEKKSLIDLVLWRYATLDTGYIEKLIWLNRRRGH